MSFVSARLRRLVVRRAGNRCEYNGLSQVGQETAFHIDHIVPESLGGQTDEDNLALACVSCSLRKEARQSATDAATGRRAPLFHPRRDAWAEHFQWNGVEIEGIAAKGRATIQLLKMNRASIHAIREEEILRGRHPPW